MTVRLTAHLTERDFGTRVLHFPFELVPTSYSHNAIGGPLRAELVATGDEKRLWDLINTLRCPVTIRDEFDRPVWWGYVSEVKIKAGERSYGVRLKEMANRIRLQYRDGAGEDTWTSWAEDTTSSGEYGDKEMQLSVSQVATTALAERWRDTELAKRKYPVPDIETGLRQSVPEATLICAGWWQTLDWQFYEQTAGYSGFTDERDTWVHVDGINAVGDSNVRAGQSFTNGALGLFLASIRVRVKKVGDPTDNLQVALWSNSGSSPNAALETIAIGPTDVSDTFGWIDVAFAGTTSMSASTVYWVVLSRSGAGDASNYYAWSTNDEDVGAGGLLKVYDASWADATGRDALFEVYGVRNTHNQLDALMTAAQFITATDRSASTSVALSPTRDGSETIKEIAEELLQVGTSNNRRLLVEVTPNRRARIYEEPATSTTDDYLMADGTILTGHGQPVPLHTCPVAKWVQLRDVIPDTANTTRIADPARMFIEESEYIVRDGRLRLRTRNIPDPWDLGG